jgi:carbon storage regulator CsrA
MVIFTRRASQALIIELPTGEIIKVAVLSVSPNEVRIATDAPDDINIVKEEMLQGMGNRVWMPGKELKESDD